MKTITYKALRAVSFIILVAGALLLGVILFWLILGHGVIACGKGIFDTATWPWDLLVILGIPVILEVSAGWLFVWSWCRLEVAEESSSHS
jgi:hypothetical protein